VKFHFLFFIFLFFILTLTSQSHAQGILPMNTDERISTSTIHIPLLIGDKVPENLVVLDSSGTPRSLLSYKAGIDILVVEFLSPSCPADAALASDLQRFYKSYKDWHVAFVAVNLGGAAGQQTLQEQFAKQRMAIPVVQDATGLLMRILKVTQTPEILIIDEGASLQYRGAFDDRSAATPKKLRQRYAQKALDQLIGHVAAVEQAEPTGPSDGCPLP
jgi:thiol-disulfide isomerase/thioredoxin